MPGDYTRCPFSIGLFIGTTALFAYLGKVEKSKKSISSTSSSTAFPDCQVVFVVGGPGAGKGTQCFLLEERLKHGWKHLSAGDLLRAERKSGGALGDLINQKIANGELVPSSITVKLLENAMAAAYQENKTTNFLIDGFPRSFENMDAWNDTMKRHAVKCMLNFECPEEVLVGRLLERGQSSGRSDDNMETIRKRFRTYQQESMPIIKRCGDEGIKIHQIASDQSVEQVYKKVVSLF
jgi:UMP-CMP kinase